MIDTPAALHALVERLLHADAVALDTEFVWEQTYYPRLGIIQVGLGTDDVYLLDAAALAGHLQPLGEVLAHPQIVKVLHDAVQDLTILHRATGALPVNVFDTQRAAGFCADRRSHLSSSVSLRDLLLDTVGVDLEKTESRTDWLQRPLTRKQQDYALDDVRYLLEARRVLRERIGTHGRHAWLAEEMAVYDDPKLYTERPPTEYFERLKVKGVSQLQPRQRAVLLAVTSWREREARRRNVPRRNVLDDSLLVLLAQRTPRSPEKLAKIPGLDDRTFRRDGEALLEAVWEGWNQPETAWPPMPPPPHDDPRLDAQTHLAMALLVGQSLELALDPDLVALRSGLRAVIEAFPHPDPTHHAVLRGWRRTFFGDDLLALLHGTGALRVDPASGLPKLDLE